MLSKPSAESSAGKSRSARKSNAEKIANRIGVLAAIQPVRRHPSGSGLTERISALEGAFDVAGHRRHLRGIRTLGSGWRHIAGAQAAQDGFPFRAVLHERVSRRQARHAQAGRGPHVAVAIRAGLCQDRADDGVELVGLAADARGREHQARADGRTKRERRGSAAPAPRRRRRRLRGNQLHVRFQNALLLLGPDDQVMMPAAGGRGKTCPAVIENCNGAGLRQSEVVVLGMHGVEHRRKGLCRQLFRLRFERADSIDNRVIRRPRGNGVERGRGKWQGFVQLRARHHDAPGPFSEQLAVPGNICAHDRVSVVTLEPPSRNAQHARFFRSPVFAAGKHHQRVQIRGRAGENDRAVLIDLRRERVAHQRSRIGGVVQLLDAARICGLALRTHFRQRGRKRRRHSVRLLAVRGHADRQRDLCSGRRRRRSPPRRSARPRRGTPRYAG